MSEENPPIEKTSLLAPIFSLYMGMVAGLYLFGYWSTFDINVLEYISLADAIKLALYPVAASITFFTTGAVIGSLLTGRLSSPSQID